MLSYGLKTDVELMFTSGGVKVVALKTLVVCVYAANPTRPDALTESIVRVIWFCTDVVTFPLGVAYEVMMS